MPKIPIKQIDYAASSVVVVDTAFNMPAPATDVADGLITVVFDPGTAAFRVGQFVAIEGCGLMALTALNVDGVTATAKNYGIDGNVAEATVVPAGSRVVSASGYPYVRHFPAAGTFKCQAPSNQIGGLARPGAQGGFGGAGGGGGCGGISGACGGGAGARGGPGGQGANVEYWGPTDCVVDEILTIVVGAGIAGAAGGTAGTAGSSGSGGTGGNGANTVVGAITTVDGSTTGQFCRTTPPSLSGQSQPAGSTGGTAAAGGAVGGGGGAATGHYGSWSTGGAAGGAGGAGGTAVGGNGAIGTAGGASVPTRFGVGINSTVAGAGRAGGGGFGGGGGGGAGGAGGLGDEVILFGIIPSGGVGGGGGSGGVGQTNASFLPSGNGTDGVGGRGGGGGGGGGGGAAGSTTGFAGGVGGIGGRGSDGIVAFWGTCS